MEKRNSGKPSGIAVAAQQRHAGPHRNKASKRVSENKHPDHLEEYTFDELLEKERRKVIVKAALDRFVAKHSDLLQRLADEEGITEELFIDAFSEPPSPGTPTIESLERAFDAAPTKSLEQYREFLQKKKS